MPSIPRCSGTLLRSSRLLFFALALGSSLGSAGNGKSYISTQKQTGSFTLSASGISVPLVVSTGDFPGVMRVAKHLQTDIGNVTNRQPPILVDSIPASKEIVLIGTLGRNPLIDELVREKKIDVADVAGKWETFVIQTIEHPFPNVARALVIIGSDKRGTIYGMFDLSEKIGVSPWYWWADVPVKKKEDIYILPGRYTLGEPKVQYRGIFINDEAPGLAGWSQEKYGTVQFNHKLYRHVFELILRLKGNFLWPAMWGRAFYDDDPENPRLADEYGVVISTSHHEPLMRAHVEWTRYGNGGKWNYDKNDSSLRQFWREGIQRMGTNESIVTLGMRGDGDEPMTEDANVALLERIVKDQRQIIAEVTEKDVTEIPQVWALYKEVQDYYDRGMRVPDDVTLLLCDDNWGNIRKLPRLTDPPRKGGYGIYYHFDYVGAPRNYKWVNTNQIERVWEQMHLAYEYGARKIWVVNVGDIKPMEFPIDFFLDYAWNPDAISVEDLPIYYRVWAEEQFGKDYAADVAELLATYTTFNARRKPELLDSTTYSLVDYREAETVVAEYNTLAQKAETINDKLPAEYRDAFFQLILHPVKASAVVNELHVATGRNHLYYKQRRSAMNGLAAKVKQLFEEDSLITHYYNNILANGKWKRQMDQTHIGYTYWQQPDFNTMPHVYTVDVPDEAEMGVAVEGSDNFSLDTKKKLVLPVLDPFSPHEYYVEIFNRGKKPFEYSVKAEKPWLNIDKKRGTIETEERLWVSVEWSKVPAGTHRIPITISGPQKSNVTVTAIVNNFSQKIRNEVQGFVESNGYVSIEAEHYSHAVGEWQTIRNLGKTGSSVTAKDVTVAVNSPGGTSPHLEYQMYLFTTGTVRVNVYLSPTLNFHSKEFRYAASFNNESPQLVSMYGSDPVKDWLYPPVWMKAVSDNIRMLSSTHTITKPGIQTLKFWLVDPGVVLQKIVVETTGMKPSYLGPPESIRIMKAAN